MNKTCYNRGSCIRCGCNVPALQMCSKGCPDCYPPLMSKTDWERYKLINNIKI